MTLEMTVSMTTTEDLTPSSSHLLVQLIISGPIFVFLIVDVECIYYKDTSWSSLNLLK